MSSCQINTSMKVGQQINVTFTRYSLATVHADTAVTFPRRESNQELCVCRKVGLLSNDIISAVKIAVNTA